MSLYKFSGTFTRSSGIWDAIAKQLRLVDLRPVKRIDYRFDPFHPAGKDVRSLVYYLSHPYVRNTNPSVIHKSEVVCDLSEPHCSVKFANGQELILKAANLSVLELLTQFNRVLKPLIPPPEPEAPTSQTKSEKKKALKRK